MYLRHLKFAFASVLFIFLLSSCATTPSLTREQYLQARKNYDVIRTKTYQDVTTEDVLKAADELFRIADVDYRIVHGETGLIAYRGWLLYLITFAMFGNDYWYVEVSEVENGTTVIIRETTETQGWFPLPIKTSITGGNSIASMVHPEVVDEKELLRQGALYSVFFKRLDYLLGITDQWLGCDQVKKYIKDNNLKGYAEPLCLLATDAKPKKLQTE